MALINDLFESYYAILVIVLVLMVPVWFGTALYEAVATILHRWRQR